MLLPGLWKKFWAINFQIFDILLQGYHSFGLNIGQSKIPTEKNVADSLAKPLQPVVKRKLDEELVKISNRVIKKDHLGGM